MRMLIKMAEASAMDWLGKNNQFQPRREFLADYPQWELFLDLVWDELRWALEEPAKAAAFQTPVKEPKVVAAVSGFRPAAFAACGKTRI